MKKKIFAALAFFAFCAAPFFAKDLEFEELLKTAATEVCEDIEGSAKSLAILDVQTEYWAVSDYIVDEFAHYFTRRFGAGNVIAHDDFTRSLIEKELDYQNSGAVSDETIQEIGRELGVDCVIIGSFTESSNCWNLFVKATQVETKKLLTSWKGKVKKTDKEVKFQIEKSLKSGRPVAKSGGSSQSAASKNSLSVTAEMIDEKGERVSVFHPNARICFRVTTNANAYLAILCIDARKEETWLPLQSNYIRAGESRIFPDLPGAVLRVEEGVFGNESVKIYASAIESELSKQGKMVSTRGLKLASENSAISEAVIEYKVSK